MINPHTTCGCRRRLHHRRDRDGAAQHHHHLHVDRADSERRQHQPGGFSSQLHNTVGQVFAISSSRGGGGSRRRLGIIPAFYRNKETVNIEMNLMRW
jgi:hypothetical protein